MIVIDSSGWIAFFGGQPLAKAYAPYVRRRDVVVPTVVLYEVYKVVKRDLSEDMALLVTASMMEREVVPLAGELALDAAEISLAHGLAMADAIVYATAQAHGATVVTSDRHFRDLPDVGYLPRSA